MTAHANFLPTRVATYNRDTDGIELRVTARAAQIIRAALKDYQPDGDSPGLGYATLPGQVSETARRIVADLNAALSDYLVEALEARS